MAIEAERLLAIFEARFTSLEKALVKAQAQSSSAFSSIEADGTKAETALSNIGSKGSPGIDRAAKSIKAFKVETGNLAAQFNDIGVQLAGGQSPFLIALQQGTQITQALGPSGVKGAVAAVGGAFLSMINPVSLATIAIIAGGGFVVQYFASLVSGGEKSAETLRQEAELIDRVTAKWGEALPALKAYNNERQRLKDQADILQAGDIEIGKQFEDAQQKVVALNVDLANVLDQVQGIAKPGQLTDLQADFRKLADSIQDHTAKAEDARKVEQDLAAIFAQSGVPAVNAMAQAVAILAAVLDNATAAQERLNTQTAAAAGRPQFPGSGGARRFANGERNTVDLPGSAPTPDSAPNREDILAAQDKAAAAAARRAARPQRLSADDHIKEDIQGLKDRTEALRQEASMIGLTFEEQQKRKMALDLEQEALRRLREEAAKKGVTDLDAVHLSPDQIATIDAASAAYGRQAEVLREVQKEQQDAEQASGEFYDTFKSGAMEAISGAKSLGDVLADLGKKFADLLLNSAFDSLFAPASGSSSGGSFGGIFGLLGKFITGSFAGGTRSAPGGPAIINERGGEIVDLPSGSRVYPHDVSMQMAKVSASGPSAAITYAPSITVGPNAQPGVTEQLQAVMKQQQREFTSNVAKSLREMKIKGIRA
ncbi:hypothetical protein FJ959_09825 [Mesorhizobium sp. B2-2-4]|uniref:phage tail length tape measure family protein n=1 Tax=unclassified Mesorhizobium TaxID=325217 RepID=UPI00112E2F68|nr:MULTISPECIES: phage tail length tape measure family protein [unclassified Mesorhizobium]TPM59157.1 hypothetical protein FJ959_09825 [Mesorhizobium sp. B2-2-4]TPM67642.1 hypothetical protein FJ965_10965 [Mesorhizobium sp. B2-2-1]TPN66924.1 hypothetical protein FJ984_15830 [Mesorhizobium sp. B1-1-3]